MKSIKSNYFFRRTIEIALKVFLIGVLLLGSGSCKPEFIIDNPYESVNWEASGRYKADLHSHYFRHAAGVMDLGFTSY